MTSATLDHVIARGRARRRLPEPRTRRFLREQVGASQREVAEILGVSRPTVVRYENGERTPSGPVLDKYLAVLDRFREELGEDA